MFGNVYVPTETGQWVSENFERLARVLMDYDENLELRWIPYDKRTSRDDKPYVIIDKQIEQPVIYAGELDSPVDILARVFESDNKHGNVLDRLEKKEAAQKALEYKKRMDEYEELEDQAKFLLDSKKNYVNYNGRKLDEFRRPVL